MKYLIALLFISLTLTLTAQPGTLDATFGNGGKVIENFSAPYVEVIDAVIQTDGKTVVLAQAEYNHISHIALIRYNTNGTLDSTFSGDGIADSPLGGPDDKEYPNAIKLQPDGKILVCGSVYTSSNEGAVIRYNANGSLDNSFGGTGAVYISDLTIVDIDNLVVLSNGQIVLLTSFYHSIPGPDLMLIKLNTDGSRNGSFGLNGIVQIQATDSYNPDYRKIEIQADGKFIIGGNYYAYNTQSQPNFLLVRVNSNGTIDNTYGTNGKFSFSPGPAAYNDFADMAIQPDGKIVAGGQGSDALRTFYSYVTRINLNGTLDNSFGVNGVQLINVASTGFGSQGQLCLQSDGKVVVAGFGVNALVNYTMAAARLTANGSLDGSFDGDGIALLQVNNYGSYGIAPVQQSDGKIVIAGFARKNTAFLPTIGRLTTVGQTDNTINAGSTAITFIGSGTSYEEGNNILVQPDQKIINVRDVSNGLSYNINITRHNTAGVLDNSFGINGKTNIDLPGYFYSTYTELLSNGKIMVAADYEDFLKGGQLALLRLNAIGNADSTFGTNGKLFFNTSATAVNSLLYADVQPNGKTVILTQEIVDIFQGSKKYLIRLNADGGYDNTFNGTGKLALSDTANYSTVHVQSDGKILLTYGNYNSDIGDYNVFLRRFNDNGTIDNTFNNGNSLLTGLYSYTLAIQPDGKIVMADADGMMIRLNTNGSFDNTFDGDGIAEPAYNFDFFGGVGDIKVQADGKIILVGSQYDTIYYERGFQAVRINSDGTLDAGFGSNGTSTVPVIPGNDNYCKGMALQGDGKILLAGSTYNSDLDYEDFAMIRLNSSNVGPTYTFTGNGAWNDPANWSNNTIPPATLPSGSTILIDPVAGGECLLSTVQHISAGATFTVKAGKKFKIAGGLILQ